MEDLLYSSYEAMCEIQLSCESIWIMRNNSLKSHKEAHYWWPPLMNSWTLFCVIVLLIKSNKFEFLKFYKTSWLNTCFCISTYQSIVHFFFTFVFCNFICSQSLSFPALNFLRCGATFGISCSTLSTAQTKFIIIFTSTVLTLCPGHWTAVHGIPQPHLHLW